MGSLAQGAASAFQGQGQRALGQWQKHVSDMQTQADLTKQNRMAGEAEQTGMAHLNQMTAEAQAAQKAAAARMAQPTSGFGGGQWRTYSDPWYNWMDPPPFDPKTQSYQRPDWISDYGWVRNSNGQIVKAYPGVQGEQVEGPGTPKLNQGPFPWLARTNPNADFGTFEGHKLGLLGSPGFTPDLSKMPAGWEKSLAGLYSLTAGPYGSGWNQFYGLNEPGYLSELGQNVPAFRDPNKYNPIWITPESLHNQAIDLLGTYGNSQNGLLDPAGNPSRYWAPVSTAVPGWSAADDNQANAMIARYHNAANSNVTPATAAIIADNPWAGFSNPWPYLGQNLGPSIETNWQFAPNGQIEVLPQGGYNPAKNMWASGTPFVST